MSKVKIGAKYPRWAKITSEAAGKLPTYDTEKVTIGELIAANMTINLASGELYSDDALNLKISEFSSGTIAMETDGLDDEAASSLYGATVEEAGGKVTYNTGDVAPYGGLAYYAMMKDKSSSSNYYKCYYFPKVQAAMGNDNTATKGSSVTFSTANTTFTVMKAENGDWMHTEIVSTETEAKTWCDTALTTAAAG